MPTQLFDYQHSIISISSKVTPNPNEEVIVCFDDKTMSGDELSTEVIFSPKDYKLGNICGREYLFAMKKGIRLLNIVPDLSIPKSKELSAEEIFANPDWPMAPVRKVPRSTLRAIGARLNRGTNKIERTESKIERDYLDLVQFDPRILHYTTQPVAIEWIDHIGKKHIYTPDLFVGFRPDSNEKPLLIEFKMEKDLRENMQLYEEKFRAASNFALSKGWTFRIFTENDLPKTLLGNIKNLHMPTTTAGSSKQLDIAVQLIRALFKKKISTPDELVKCLPSGQRSAGFFVIWMLISRGDILCDLHERLTNYVNISLAPKYIEEITIKSTLLPKAKKKIKNGKSN